MRDSEFFLPYYQGRYCQSNRNAEIHVNSVNAEIHVKIALTLFFLSARQYGLTRVGLEGLQSDHGLPLQVQGQSLYQEPWRVRPSPSVLPERPQRDVQSSPYKRL